MFSYLPSAIRPLRANTFRLGFRLAARGGELGAGELARRIGIGPREFLAGGDRPFLEAQPAVMVGIELRIGLATRRKKFVAGDDVVALLLVAVAALLRLDERRVGTGCVSSC